jgi:hypothetical protein
MRNRFEVTLLSAALAAFLLPATAQNSTAPAQNSTAPAQNSSTPAQATSPSTGQSKTETGDQLRWRQEHQQDRISQGIKDGQLTGSEAAGLETKESDISKEEKAMRNADGGHLTTADRQAIQQQQNQLSNQIYKDKHNAAVGNPDPKTEVDKRVENQQDRIGQGIQSGQLTTGEAANLENKEAGLNQEIRKDRAANGGKLTAQERAQVNRQQNHLSKQIYKDKHNHQKR